MEVNSLNWAKAHTCPASLAGRRINRKFGFPSSVAKHLYTFKTTVRKACPAADAVVFPYLRLVPAEKLSAYPYRGMKYQMQIRCIHIGIRNYGIFRKCRKGRSYRGFPCSAFAAYYY
jgi:hypothetical protein